ncbi:MULTISPECIES: outer membrane protein assembly factor BamA [unclassified Polaromonas]|jgi:outer membrane protein insertion porin family|uniref:outer membrane protein assembly factor BamA n=1 Tax=unclassified Polaromonas TaxID=2638319 RepID=UPI000BD5486F|nr:MULTISPECIES: outer membrane protein assembly factor BamA [unclassified Polaromonas]OYY39083.1 MAG: outer membrane protein assembly factor BamA [Polaromonas sp. 35-63-35]OYZ21948.1 MAG: outer membrane protein assembly factor BamA [Polaromonas sp. 16-63-31]OYZ80385.1 MAG: outer membrane protein assembly factor BamA [Polaromonas sp. 24-63-21]OZA51449.1 MAG: outer membrane protein assembly factor BamA [Polaromonas sp. 17-63-33]OZA90081.1 MAG: outer membrane protein assembly factor BamA [Polaro
MQKQIKRFKVRSVSAVVASFLIAHAAWAVDPFTVRDIRVEGLQRVEPGTIFASLPFRVGETYNDDKGAGAIRALFGLGLFKDVRLEVSGDVLVVIVEERPTVADVDFVGAKEFDKEVLKKALREIGLTDGRPFDKALADRAEQELKRQYINRSLYGAEVVTTVTPIERNRVNVTFSVTEGDVAKIKEIRIVGNKVFSESTLRGLFDLDTGGWLSWYTKSDRYSRAKLNADIETLRSYYLTRGYLEFKVDSTQVAISPNKQDISVTINVTEGERFTVSGVKLEGNFLEREDEFKSLVTIKPGEPYNADQVAQTVKAFVEYYGSFGFAFAKVDAQPEIDRTNNRVAFVLQGEPSRRAYVRRINISGNNRTRDEVVRREFRQFEASWYDGDKIRLSRDRVDRLGFFTEVNIDTQEVPGTPDQVDLNLAVVEKPTGNLQLGAGFSSADRLSLVFGFKQENAFGTGNYLGLEVNTGKYNRQLVLSTVDPYFTNDGISRTIDVYTRTSRPYSSQIGVVNTDYELKTTGASVRFGVPFSEVDTVYFGGGLEQIDISGTNLPAVYQTYVNTFGAKSNSVPLTIGWSRDERDSAIVPTKGRFQRVYGDWGVAGDARFLRTNYQFQQYIPLNKQFTIALNTELGWGKGLNGQPFPVFKNFYSGGLGSVRGYEPGTLGPRDSQDNSIGGPKKITLNAEILAPFPGAGNDRTLRLFGFVDAGNVFGENEKYDLGELRSSVGFGVSWISPLGPLRLAFAHPMNKKPTDKIQRLQFQIGTSF